MIFFPPELVAKNKFQNPMPSKESKCKDFSFAKLLGKISLIITNITNN